VYSSRQPAEVDAFSASCQHCTSVVCNWMLANRLQLDSVSGRRQHQLPTTAMSRPTAFQFRLRTLDLGTFIDSDLAMTIKTHIRRPISGCFTALAPLTTSDQQLGADGHIPVIDGGSGDADSTTETNYDLQTLTLRSHCRRTGQLALAARPGVRRLQDRCIDVQGCVCDLTGVSRTCFLCRQPAWLTGSSLRWHLLPCGATVQTVNSRHSYFLGSRSQLTF